MLYLGILRRKISQIPSDTDMRLLFAVVFFLLASAVSVVAGTGVTLRFVPTYAGSPVVLEQYYQLHGGDSVMFETFKCYISDITFYKAGKQVLKEKNSYHLLNAENEETMSLFIHMDDSIHYDEVQFNMGIDSATSTSGALGEDLDPAKGMFWTWQSGYINCKIEGRSNLCKTRHNEFQLHLGGYAVPDNSLQEVRLTIPEGVEVDIAIPLDKFLSRVDIAKHNAIMSPGQDAVVVARKLASVFEVKK